jgi:hypothetical protein
MAFLFADSLQAILDILNGEEQKADKLAAFKLYTIPANPGLQCHRLDNIKDKSFWSVRASRKIRICSGGAALGGQESQRRNRVSEQCNKVQAFQDDRLAVLKGSGVSQGRRQARKVRYSSIRLTELARLVQANPK